MPPPPSPQAFDKLFNNVANVKMPMVGPNTYGMLEYKCPCLIRHMYVLCIPIFVLHILYTLFTGTRQSSLNILYVVFLL